MLKSYKNILLIILAVFVVFAAGIVLMPKKEQVIDNGKNKELQERQKELQIKFEQTKKEELRKKMQEENKPEEVLKEGEEKVNENILCDDESLKEASKKLKEIVLNKDEDSLDNNKIFKNYISCFFDKDFNKVELRDINNDNNLEMVLFFGENAFCNILQLMILQDKDDLYKPIKFIHTQNKEDTIKNNLIIYSEDKVFKDFDNDGTFEIVGYWDTVYLFQDNKPSCYWEENIYSLSPDNKKMAWIIPTITEIDNISIGLYFFKTDEIKTFYSGETNMYSILMKYLKWIDNENFMFIKKNCTEGGCGFSISKLNINSGNIEILKYMNDEVSGNLTEEGKKVPAILDEDVISIANTILEDQKRK